MTFQEYLKKENLSEKTISIYLWTVDYYSKNYDSLTKENLLAYKGYLLEYFKPKTVNLRIQAINKYLDYKELRQLQLSSVKIQQKSFLENVVSNADYNFLKKQLKKDENMQWYFVVWYLAATGARVSELIKIKIEHVNLGYFDLYSKESISTRLVDESSLLITDIIVELEDGSIANLECQKIGYLFPGQRSACYSADMLLRQYKRVRGEQKKKDKKFSYRNIKRVYTIVLFEQSTKEFHKVPEEYVHRVKYQADTDLKIEMLQEFIFVPLDIFLKHLHNRGIRSDLDAWLAFLSTDEPETVAELYEDYPEFRGMYEDVYELCRNMEKVMEMFSKELLELDRNTVQYMIDEMQDMIDSQKNMLAKKDGELAKKDDELAEKNNLLRESREMIERLMAENERLKAAGQE